MLGLGNMAYTHIATAQSHSHYHAGAYGLRGTHKLLTIQILHCDCTLMILREAEINSMTVVVYLLMIPW